MRNWRGLRQAIAAVLVVALQAAPASAQTLGGSCAGSPYSSDQISVVQNNVAVCNTSQVWQNLIGAPAADPNYSIALGASALSTVTSGTYNIAIGANAMAGTSAYPLTGVSACNIAIGDSALYQIRSAAKDNTTLGYEAGYAITTGTDNTLIGFKAGLGVTGSDNIILGEDPSSAITSGSSNILIGNSLISVTNTSSNQLNIGNLIYGNLNSGTVGIDATAPNALLSIGNTTSAGSITLNGSANSNADSIEILFSGSLFGTGYGGLIFEAASGDPSYGFEGININTSDGNSISLHAGSISINTDNGSVNSILTANHNSTAYLTIEQNTSSNLISLVGSGSNNLAITTFSEVGIGTPSPAGTLDVEGGTAAASTAGANVVLTAQNGGTGNTNGGSILLNVGTKSGSGTTGTVQISGAASGPAFMTTSDARIKTNITPLENGLAGIASLEGVTYTYRPAAEREVGKELNLPVEKRQMGVIAQNVEQVFPEAVGTIGTTGVKSVNYNMLMAPMIEAVKTLNRRIDALMAAVALLYVGLAVLAGLFVMHMRRARSS